MALLSQALHLGYLLSPHSAFQGHAAHTARWPAMLSPNGSSDTCIANGVFHIPMPCFHGALPVYPKVLLHFSIMLHGTAQVRGTRPLMAPSQSCSVNSREGVSPLMGHWNRWSANAKAPCRVLMVTCRVPLQFTMPLCLPRRQTGAAPTSITRR